MLISSDGIVLRQRKIANNRRIIVIFTRKYGKISAGTSINEKGRSRSALALRPFTYAEYDIFKGRDSYNINNASVKKSYYSIGEDLDRFLTASSLIDYLDKILPDEEPMPAIFDLAIEFLESVSRPVRDPDTLLYAFITKTIRILGVMPELGCCADCGKESSLITDLFFSVTSGGIVCDECAKREKTDPSALIYKPPFDIIDVFRFFLSKPLNTFETVRLKDNAGRVFRQILAEYTSMYLDVDVLRRPEEMEV